MSQVTKLQLSCYLVLLSFGNKTRQQDSPNILTHLLLTALLSSHTGQHKQTQIARLMGGNMGPTWGRQYPGGPHVGPMNIVIWVRSVNFRAVSEQLQRNVKPCYYTFVNEFVNHAGFFVTSHLLCFKNVLIDTSSQASGEDFIYDLGSNFIFKCPFGEYYVLLSTSFSITMTSQWARWFLRYQPQYCLPNGFFRRRSMKTSKLRVSGLCLGNSPMTSECSAQRASNVENVFIWWRHHGEPYLNSTSCASR